MTDVEIRRLVIEAIRTGQNLQYNTILQKIVDTAQRDGLGAIATQEQVQIKRVLWDLAVQRVISWGTETNSDATWPFFHVTPLGRKFLDENPPHYFDPDGYVGFLKSLVSSVDPIVLQYVHEAVNAYRSTLYFAAAVMLGAAAERTILQLLETIRNWQPDPKGKAKLTALLNQPRLTQIYSEIDKTISSLSKSNKMPYSVHQGSAEHLLSFLEMVRVQRNDAVHPHAATVDREKVYLALQSFPVAYQVLERVRAWF